MIANGEGSTVGNLTGLPHECATEDFIKLMKNELRLAEANILASGGAALCVEDTATPNKTSTPNASTFIPSTISLAPMLTTQQMPK